MSAIINSEMISRRKALSLMGLAAALGLAGASTLLTVSDAEAQTAGMESGVRSGAQGAQIDVRSDAQVQLPAQERPPAQVPGRNSNSTGSAKSLIEPLERASPCIGHSNYLLPSEVR